MISGMASKAISKRAWLAYCILHGGVERRWVVRFADGRIGITVWGAGADRVSVLRNAVYGVNAR